MRAVLVALYLLGSAAFANEPPTLDVIRSAIANRLDAITTPCPEALEGPAACYEYAGGVELHKLALDAMAATLDDFSWLVPWQPGPNGGLARAFALRADGPAYLIALVAVGRGSVAVVLPSGVR